MKKKVRASDPSQQPLAHLGGLSTRQFLHRHWQKKPLLVRNAFPEFADPLTKREVFELSQREEAECRLIVHSTLGWTLQPGPLRRRDFSASRNTKWTVLVQDTQHFSHEAHELLAMFNFIPSARIDDLMVSFAVPGAGVGPHVDSYDVFLIQGSGRRRWRISAQEDLRLKPGLPLKILKKFRPEQEFILEKGDMLYLPPGYAHDGIAETDCLTWSVGCRAPSQQELSTALLDFLRDETAFVGQYSDPDLSPAKHPGEIDVAMQKRVAGMLIQIQDATRSDLHQRRFLGRYLTDPKPHVFFDAPDPPMSRSAFRQSAAKKGVRLDLKTRFLFSNDLFFMNGGDFPVKTDDAALFRHLADMRRLSPELVTRRPQASFIASLYRAYSAGFLHLT